MKLKSIHKHLLVSIITVSSLLASCSKKNDLTPASATNNTSKSARQGGLYVVRERVIERKILDQKYRFLWTVKSHAVVTVKCIVNVLSDGTERVKSLYRPEDMVKTNNALADIMIKYDPFGPFGTEAAHVAAAILIIDADPGLLPRGYTFLKDTQSFSFSPMYNNVFPKKAETKIYVAGATFFTNQGKIYVRDGQ